MSQLDIVLEHAEKKCKMHGGRLTLKRKRILSILLKSKKALSAYELASCCEAEFDDALPVMSIYRILQFLEAHHLAHRLNVANKYVACAFISSEQSHEHCQFLICQQCQRVEEIQINQSAVKELYSNVAATGFSLVRPQVEMECICHKCVSHDD